MNLVHNFFNEVFYFACVCLQNALLSALPYLAMWLISLAVSPISDYLINRGVIGIATGRKLFNSFGHWVPAVTLIILPFLRDPILAIAMLTIAIGMNGCTYCGYMVNHMDLSPNFAGSLMGLTNSLANTMSILGPITVGLILTDESDIEVSQKFGFKSKFDWNLVISIDGCDSMNSIFFSFQGKMAEWKIIFFVAAAFYFTGNLIFVIFGKASIQPWNEPTDEPTNSTVSDDEKLGEVFK